MGLINYRDYLFSYGKVLWYVSFTFTYTNAIDFILDIGSSLEIVWVLFCDTTSIHVIRDNHSLFTNCCAVKSIILVDVLLFIAIIVNDRDSLICNYRLLGTGKVTFHRLLL